MAGNILHVFSPGTVSREMIWWPRKSTASCQTTTFLLWAHCAKIHGPQKNAGDSSLSRIGPGFVSQDEADLLRREAFPCLDPNLPSGADKAREFNLYPPAILMQGRYPFVISISSQREVASQLGWESLLFIWGGPLWALWALWTILGQSEIWGVLARSPK